MKYVRLRARVRVRVWVRVMVVRVIWNTEMPLEPHLLSLYLFWIVV